MSREMIEREISHVDYNYRHPPFKHQLEVLNRSWKKRNFALFMEMGTGKTKVTIDNAAWLYDASGIDCMLVIAPKGVYRNWTNREIPTHMPDHITYLTADWTPSPNKKQQEELKLILQPSPYLRILAMNIEAVRTKHGKKMAEAFLKSGKTMMVVDESTIIKTPTAQQTKEILALGPLATCRRILTGSPVTNNPLDLFSQCLFLDKSLLGYDNYYSFRARYAILQSMDFGSGHATLKVVGHKNTAELAQKLEAFSYRVTKEQCLDLPSKLYTTRDVELTKEQAKAYKELTKQAFTLFNDKSLTIDSVLQELLRIQQVLCGYLVADDKTISELPNNRIDTLLDVIEELDCPTIIWARFQKDVEKIAEALQSEYGKMSTVTYYGPIPAKEREEAVDAFQDPENPVRFFVGTPSTAGYGLTLTQARGVVYYSNGFRYDERQQSEDRAHRIGQKHNVTYVDLIARDTIDVRILKALQSKMDIATQVLKDNPRNWVQL